MTRKQRRLTLIGGSLGVLALAAVLVLSALKDSIVFFNSPTDVVEKHVAPGTRIRLGGLVKEGSVQRGDNLAVRFEVTDGNKAVSGQLPGHPARPVPRGAGRGDGRNHRAGRRLQGRFRFGQARRKVYAQGSGRCLEEARPVGRGQRQEMTAK